MNESFILHRMSIYDGTLSGLKNPLFYNWNEGLIIYNGKK